MSENTRVSTPPPAAAKDKGKARLPRARLGEIYMHDRDDYDVWSGGYANTSRGAQPTDVLQRLSGEQATQWMKLSAELS